MRIPKAITWALLALALVSCLVRGAGAQTSALTVAVTRVDSDRFPQVTLYVSVTDEKRLPVVGLGEADFWVKESGVQIPAGSFRVESDASQNVGLVLAVDVSTFPDESSIIAMQDAARSLVRMVGDGAEVAVIAFGETVEVRQGFAAPQQAMSAIDGLLPLGRFTAFNQMLAESVDLAMTSSMAHKAVVVIHDCLENIGDFAFEDTLARVQAAHIPVYTVGFGPKIDRLKLDELAQLIEAAGGMYFVLDQPEQIHTPVQAIGLLLRQGYRITYRSDLIADGGEHDLVVGVSRGGQTAEAGGRLTATGQDVELSLAGVEDGETVGGTVGLAATTSSSVVSVKYILDDQVLVEIAEPPFCYSLDTAALPVGEHVLTVETLDSAGNVAVTTRRINVVPPVVVTAIALQSQVDRGVMIDVEAQVVSQAKLLQVDLLVDGRLYERREGKGVTSPVRFSVDSAVYPPGEHLITVRARDVTGRQDESSLDVQIVSLVTPTPRPTLTPQPQKKTGWALWKERVATDPWRKRLKVAFLIFVIALIVFATLLLLAALAAWQKKRRRRVLPLQVCNLGNMSSRYELFPQEPAGVLKFKLLLDGKALSRREMTETVEVVERATPARAAPARAVPAGRPQRPAPRSKPRWNMRAAQSVAMVLDAIASILPQSWRAPFRNASRSIRRTRSKVSQVQRTSARISGVVKSLPSGTPQPGAAIREEAQPAGAPQPGAAVREEAQPAVVRKVRKVARAWYLTPNVEPGGVLDLSLIIDPTWRAKTQYYIIRVLSRSVDQDDAPVVTGEERVPVTGFSWFLRLIPFLLIVAAAVFLIVMVVGWI